MAHRAKGIGQSRKEKLNGESWKEEPFNVHIDYATGVTPLP